ncbi:MAG: outer membrane protein assembly factor BamD [Candidatus Binatia bacterium]
MNKRVVIAFVCCCSSLLLLSGCSTTTRRLSAKGYYSDASTAFNQEDFGFAAERYQELLDQYPLNPYAEEAQLKIAYSYYLEKQYTEALAAFSDFERTYPTSSHIPFVQYYRGLSYLEQMRSIDRDQSVTEKANEFFRAVSDRYGDSAFVKLAENKSRICRESLAEHELYVIDFQLKRDALLAAKVRLRQLLEEYPETDAATKGLVRLQDLLNYIGKKDLATLATQALAARQGATSALAQVAAAPIGGEEDGEEEEVVQTPPVVDPLLTLVTELKKTEDEERKLTAHPPGSEPGKDSPNEMKKKALEKEAERLIREGSGGGGLLE